MRRRLRNSGLSATDWSQVYDLVDFRQATVIADAPPERRTILHLHGTTEEPRSIVLDTRGYKAVAGNLGVRDLFTALMARKRLCLLGTQLAEPYLISTFGQISVPDSLHPLFAGPDTAEEARERATIGQVEHNILICEMPSRDHLQGVVSYMAYGSPGTEDVEPERGAGEPVPEPEGGYVPTVIARCNPERDDQTTNLMAEWAASGSSFGSSDAGEDFLTESDVAAGRRNLLFGVPGSGKSETLGELARVMPAGVEPVIVRLRNVTLEPADVAVRLERWAARGQVPRGLVINAETLESRTFHFLIDGLDEMPPSDQGRVVDMILEAADAFPQHSFTVASRPVEAAADFPDAWRCLRLMPGSVWQRRYLERHEVDLATIVDAIEGGWDMRELLQLPFFLTRAVGLHRRGLLDGLDLWGVIRRLTDEALAEESGRALLPLSPEAARQWLRDVALALHLAGRTLLRHDEVHTIELSDEVRGQAREICEALVQRAMMQESDEGFAFAHRIIGEGLAAEALAERGPSKVLLEAIAPLTADGLSGVRADWRVSLTLLMLKDQAWREAVRERDEAAVGAHGPRRRLDRGAARSGGIDLAHLFGMADLDLGPRCPGFGPGRLGLGSPAARRRSGRSGGRDPGGD